MTRHILEELFTSLVDRTVFVIVANTMPPRDPDEEEDDTEVCDTITKKCDRTLSMLLMVDQFADDRGHPSEFTLAQRALGYIFANVCAPAQLPF